MAKTKDEWLSLRCPACRSTLRIRAAHAHLRGRCPECGYRIEAPRPPSADAARPPRASDADEPLGLMPIEEEWPEPAQVVSVDSRPNYELDTRADAPPPAAQPQPPRPEPAGPVYGLKEGEWKTPPPGPGPDLNPTAMDDPVAQETGAPVLYRLSEAELNPLRPPPPPPYPLLQGIYFFPWRPDNLTLWGFLALDFTIVAGLFCLLRELFGFLEGGSMIAGLIPPAIAAISILCLWIGCYAGVHFLSVIEETAAGNDRFPRAEWTVWEGLMKCCFLLGLFAVSAAPGALLGRFVLERRLGAEAAWWLSVLPAALLFPPCLLSVLSTNAAWKVFDPKVVFPMLRPRILICLFVPSLAMLALCLFLGYLTLRRGGVAMVPAAGAVWASCFLIYARLLGRVAWYVSLREEKKPGRKKRPRPRPEPEPEPAEEE